MSSVKYSVIIPTLNEKENILTLIQRIEALFPKNMEIIVVDEHSPDGTYQLVSDYASSNERVEVILNTKNPGLSTSVVSGFDFAKGEFLCCMDGDLQHNENDLSKLFEQAQEHDFIIGSRYVDGGGFAQKWSWIRHLVSKTAAMLTRLMLNIRVKDPMSGYFVIQRSTYKEIRPNLNPKGYKIMLELLFNLKNSKEDYSVREVGIIFRNRIKGKSKLSWKVIRQFIEMLFELRRRRST